MRQKLIDPQMAMGGGRITNDTIRHENESSQIPNKNI